MNLTALSSDALTSRLCELLRKERDCLVEFLWHLVEYDRRKGYADEYGTLWNYCTQHLGLSDGAAYRRIHASWLLAKFPVIADYVADGRLGLSTLVPLEKVLEPHNHLELLDKASNLTKDQVLALVAARHPRPEVRDTVRAVPVRHVAVPLTSAAEVTLVALPPPPPRIEPVNEERVSVTFHASKEFRDELEQVKSALSHSVPSGKLEDVLRECIRMTLEACAKQKLGASGRGIKPSVRKAVWKRDGGCCAHVSASGKRCNSTWMLEFHHLDPYARGGAGTAENIALRCKAHNQHQARMDFGDEHMARYAASS